MMPHELFISKKLISYSMENTLLLGYWNIRGRGHPPRLTLEAVGAKYEEKRYTVEEAAEWFENDKKTIPCVTPNLPYLKDGDFMIMEHDAIVRHVAREHKPELLGRTKKERAFVDMFFSKSIKMNF